MTADPNGRPENAAAATLSTGADQPMSAQQAATLKRLSIDAYEPDAFNARLTRREAERRIAALQAKLTRLDAPPHTL